MFFQATFLGEKFFSISRCNEVVKFDGRAVELDDVVANTFEWTFFSAVLNTNDYVKYAIVDTTLGTTLVVLEAESWVQAAKWFEELHELNNRKFL